MPHWRHLADVLEKHGNGSVLEAPFETVNVSKGAFETPSTDQAQTTPADSDRQTGPVFP